MTRTIRITWSAEVSIPVEVEDDFSVDGLRAEDFDRLRDTSMLGLDEAVANSDSWEMTHIHDDDLDRRLDL